ncbi:MAG: substrate-binding domain-containing protein [Albidovulum sp.]|nr:substrate-binding domain-containing protein [Albidovulum sp.]
MNLKQLSETLGLSQTTVSRALNGYPEVSQQTRSRVLQAARQYNYRPNAFATRLATGRSKAIGHVVPVSSKREIVNPIFFDFVAGAGETYTSRGYEMLLTVVNDMELENAYRTMAQKSSVDGIILQAPHISDPRIEILNEIGLPFVVHGRSSREQTDYSWVDINNRSAFRRATDYLLDLEHRRIGLINGLEILNFAHRRRLGYEEALLQRGVRPDPDLMRSGDMTEPYGRDSVHEMIGLPDPPTAFVVSSILPAIGARRAVQELGLRLGRDISIVIHDDVLSYLGNSGEIPMFTATRSSVRDAGRRCSELLIDIIEKPELSPIQELWEVDLVEGASTGPGPGRI